MASVISGVVSYEKVKWSKYRRRIFISVTNTEQKCLRASRLFPILISMMAVKVEIALAILIASAVIDIIAINEKETKQNFKDEKKNGELYQKQGHNKI